MTRRAGPSRAFRTRDAHRRWLGLHFILYLAGLVAAFLANRALTPEIFWVQWVALGWGVLLLLHGIHFARGTLATMGGSRD
jgi:2TM domain-containing protein